MHFIKSYLKKVLSQHKLIRAPSLQFDCDGQTEIRLNILLPRLLIKAMTGGPNTAFHIGQRCTDFAKVRYISCFGPDDKNLEAVRAHIGTIVPNATEENICLEAGNKKNKTIGIGENDVFMATWWPTAHLAGELADKYGNGKFIYLIQDFEPGFYPWSSNYANSLHTYELDFYAIINERLLLDYLKSLQIGFFSQERTLENRVATFWPAVDSDFFYPEQKSGDKHRKRKLVFYSRPNTPRNLYNIGIETLKKATSEANLSSREWEVLLIGENQPAVSVNKELRANPQKWLDFRAYSRLIRTSDVLFSLMLSPHTSYPVLEAAKSRVWVVTNTFFNKTSNALSDLSPFILSAPPAVSLLKNKLIEALELAQNNIRPEQSLSISTQIEDNWDSALQSVIDRMPEFINGCLKHKHFRKTDGII